MDGVSILNSRMIVNVLKKSKNYGGTPILSLVLKWYVWGRTTTLFSTLQYWKTRWNYLLVQSDITLGILCISELRFYSASIFEKIHTFPSKCSLAHPTFRFMQLFASMVMRFTIFGISTLLLGLMCRHTCFFVENDNIKDIMIMWPISGEFSLSCM